MHMDHLQPLEKIPPAAIKAFEDALRKLSLSETAVSCGAQLAPNCSSCAPDGCLGDCVRLKSGECVPIDPSQPVEPPLAAAVFKPKKRTLHVVESSPLSAAALSLLIAADSDAAPPSLDVGSTLKAAQFRRELPPPPQSDWLLALLRDPLHAFESEMLPHPELVRGASRSVARSDGSLRIRFSRLLRCCSVPLARSLIETLPPSEATARCTAPAAGRASTLMASDGWNASSGPPCDEGTMHALARRALLRLPWFGLLSAPLPSLALLERTLGVRVPTLPATAVRAMRHPSWPRPPVPRGRARGAEAPIKLTPPQVRAWRTANKLDVQLYQLAASVLAYRVRVYSLPERAVLEQWLRNGQGSVSYSEADNLASSRVFDTSVADGRRPLAVQPPVLFRRQHDTLVFVHIAKCGGTSFNRRLTLLDAGLPCECAPVSTSSHNGHHIVQPRACECLRNPADQFHPEWSDLAMQRLSRKRRRVWAFLQKQWLLSPETSGWLGGVHAPVRVLQNYVMLSARLAAASPLSHGIHYIALLREPITRFLSEFYETYDGWEAKFGTPPRLPFSQACSMRLPRHLKARADEGIDNTSKALYDELFAHWIRCPTNMAASRQTRALSYAALTTASNIAGNYNATDFALRDRLCDRLPRRGHDPNCSLHLARTSLYQFTFIGLNEDRCATEKLLEAQFGLRFNRTISDGGANRGKGAHKVARLDYAGLDAPTRQRVRWLNREDLLLVAEAKLLFRRRLCVRYKRRLCVKRAILFLV